MLETAEKLARFLVRLEYPRGDVMETLHRDFPDADLEAVYAQALAQKELSDAQVEAQLRREAAAATAAEHDLSRSIHEPPR